MLVGYNTNVSFKNNIYHIQTEDSGKNNPVIVTLLYSQGAILASKKTDYAHIIQEPDLQEKVRTIMKVQHKAMIKELFTGQHTGENSGEIKTGEVLTKVKETREAGELKVTIEQKDVQEVKEIIEDIQEQKGQALEETLQQPGQKEEGKDQISQSLDDILLNFIMKRAK